MENVNVGAAHPRNVRANVRINAPPNLDDLMQFANSNVIHLFGGAIQLKVSKFLDILLRLPPLFLMDQILLHDMGFNYFSPIDVSEKIPLDPKIHFNGGYSSNDTNIDNTNNFTEKLSDYQKMLANGTASSGAGSPELDETFMAFYKDYITSIAFNHLFSFTTCLSMFWFSMLWISLTTRQLLWFYMYMCTLACLPISYLVNNYSIELIRKSSPMIELEESKVGPISISDYLNLENATLIQILFVNLIFQAIFGTIICNVGRNFVIRTPFFSEELFNRSVTVMLFLPASLEMFGIRYEHSTVISLIPAILMSLFILSKVLRSAFHSVMFSIRTKRQFIANFGFNTFLEAEWVRLRIPSLLRTFWLTRMMQQLFNMIAKSGISSDQGLAFSDAAARVALTYMLEVGRELIIRGAETLIALLGMTSVVSKVCHYVGSFFHYLLANSTENEEEKSVASVSAILFFILALQTGLTSLEPEKRFSRICKNLCLLLTALFHFIHNNVSPVLMSLTAGQRSASELHRHLRALSICFFLIVSSLSLMAILWQWFTIGTWLLAVSAFCIEVVVKVIVTVSVYGLFLYDARVREGTWEGLDDAVYYVKAVGNTVEFCFAVFLFFNGGWILFFESGGTIRAVMMVVHAYFNIWCEAKSGWKTFMKRRTAVAKINSLPFATIDEIQNHDDVCAICYMDMTTTAKVTQCRHFFHSVCLKKWLYMQDTCPLCHAVLYKDPLLKGRENSNNGGTPAENNGGNGNNLEINNPDGNPNHDPENVDIMDDDSDLNNTDIDDLSENENDLVDHDDPPYQAPPLMVLDQESDDDGSDDSNNRITRSDLESNNRLTDSDSSASTGLSSTSDDDEDDDDNSFEDEDDDDDDEIIFHTAEHDGEEEEILNLMENQDSDTSENQEDSDSEIENIVDQNNHTDDADQNTNSTSSSGCSSHDGEVIDR